MMDVSGVLSKMAADLPAGQGEAHYHMVLDDYRVAMKPLLGQSISLHHLGEIFCQACHRRTKKSYSGGFCFPCSQTLARCDLCVMKPETCHYDIGTCREPEWGESFCMRDHIVYLANSSSIKVGITRVDQIPTRWIDQGATQAMSIVRVKSRYQSGLVEVILKAYVSDRTDWRKMLKGSAETANLPLVRDQLMTKCSEMLAELRQHFSDHVIRPLLNEPVVNIAYPVQQYPDKVQSFNFDKTPEISGVLWGIKGQYLILDTGVLNIRKFSGYNIALVA